MQHYKDNFLIRQYGPMASVNRQLSQSSSVGEYTHESSGLGGVYVISVRTKLTTKLLRTNRFNEKAILRLAAEINTTAHFSIIFADRLFQLQSQPNGFRELDVLKVAKTMNLVCGCLYISLTSTGPTWRTTPIHSFFLRVLTWTFCPNRSDLNDRAVECCQIA